MPEPVVQGFEFVGHLFEIIGAAALILGFLMASFRCLGQIRPDGAAFAFRNYRKALGRVILVGLELLVAVTIVRTITIDGSIESLGLLAIMVAIRVVLGWTTVLEMNGRWPWQGSTHPGSR